MRTPRPHVVRPGLRRCSVPRRVLALRERASGGGGDGCEDGGRDGRRSEDRRQEVGSGVSTARPRAVPPGLRSSVPNPRRTRAFSRFRYIEFPICPVGPIFAFWPPRLAYRGRDRAGLIDKRCSRLSSDSPIMCKLGSIPLDRGRSHPHTRRLSVEINREKDIRARQSPVS